MTGTRGSLMVLGAGVSQVPGIRAAVARGLRVLTVDWDLRNPGHRYSHACAEASTTDPDAVLRIARRERPDGIVTFASDVATGTAAKVTAMLDLPGCPLHVVQVLSDKGLLRAAQHAHGLAAPNFAIGETADELRDAWRSMGGSVMIKPVDSSGSRGVHRVPPDDERTYRSAFDHAKSFSRSGKVCVEQFLPGHEVGGDAVVARGELVFLQCTHKHRRGFLVAGHSLPSDVTPEQQQAVAAAVLSLCRATGYRDGVLNFDVMVDGSDATVIEMSPRTGGNGIPALLAAVTGVDTVQASISFALGADLPALAQDARFESGGSVVLGMLREGPVANLRSEEQVRAALPELVEYVCEAPASGVASAWIHGGASLGYCVFGCPAGVSYEDMAARARAAVGIEGLVT